MYHFSLPYLFFWQNVASSRVPQFRLLLLSLLCRLRSSLLVSSGRCGSFLSSSTRTPSAELTVHAAFFSVCSFYTLSPHAARYHFHLPYLFSRQMWQLL
ncbi:hypothetical protein TB2_013880 [Malus domestica]